jgi:hypothetical protein
VISDSFTFQSFFDHLIEYRYDEITNKNRFIQQKNPDLPTLLRDIKDTYIFAFLPAILFSILPIINITNKQFQSLKKFGFIKLINRNINLFLCVGIVVDLIYFYINIYHVSYKNYHYQYFMQVLFLGYFSLFISVLVFFIILKRLVKFSVLIYIKEYVFREATILWNSAIKFRNAVKEVNNSNGQSSFSNSDLKVKKALKRLNTIEKASNTEL